MKKKTTNKKKSIKNSNIAKNKNIINIKINTQQRKRRQRQQNETRKETNKAGEVVFLPARTIYQQAPLQPVQNSNIGELENIRESVKRQEDLFAKYLNTINLAGRGEVLNTEIPLKPPAPKPVFTESLGNLPIDSASTNGTQTLNEVDTNNDKDTLLSTTQMSNFFDTEDESEYEKRLTRTNERQKKKKIRNFEIVDDENENALNKIMMNNINRVKYDEKFYEYVELKKRINGTSTNKRTKNKLNTIDKVQAEIDKLLAREAKSKTNYGDTRNILGE